METEELSQGPPLAIGVRDEWEPLSERTGRCPLLNAPSPQRHPYETVNTPRLYLQMQPGKPLREIPGDCGEGGGVSRDTGALSPSRVVFYQTINYNGERNGDAAAQT